ncbi:MAG: OsmC family protein [Flavobacteriales bacterium]
MDTAHITYLGALRTTCTHVRSGERIVTDAPIDNKGKGEAFSPTDLLATALGGCILTTMAIVAAEKGYAFDSATARVVKHMASSPRRVQRVEVHIELDGKAFDPKARSIMEHTALTCPVARSLAGDLEQDIRITYK